MMLANKIGVLILLLLFFVQANGQKKSDQLKMQQRKLEEKIHTTKNLLGNAAESKKSTMVELNILSQQVRYREQLLGNMTNQLKQLRQDIQDNEKSIEILQEDIEKLIEQYKKMLFYAYKNRNNYHRLLFVFSAKTVHQAYRRMKYVQHFKDYVRRQIAMIRDSKEELQEKIKQLENQKKEQQTLIANKDIEKRQFLSAKRKQKGVLNELKSKEDQLKEDLQEQKDKKEQLEAAIKEAIAEEIRKAREKSQDDNSAEETREKIQLEGQNFEANKGALPMPVQRGEVTGKFGKQSHPLHKGVYINNNGVDITTSLGANMKSIYKGTVTSVFVIAGSGKVVMVSHGNYRSVYANLQSVYVKKGDKIDMGQPIGSIRGNKGGSSEGHFEIWQIKGSNMKQLNPLYWVNN